MPLVADRFFRVGEEGEILDLATGGAVRLTLEAAGTQTRERGAACDRLAGLRHPLLLPLVDYGMHGTRWFEAHARLPALRIAGVQARDAALHLVRFLRTAGVELDAALSARNVRAAIEAPAAPWRPIGVWLRWRAAVDAVRSVIESPGPPGVTAITLHAPEGAGLHTARLQIARAARLAGFVPMDSRFGALEEAMRPARHLSVLEWLPPAAALPAALAGAAAAGARRHRWIRFCRYAPAAPGTTGLEPFPMHELIPLIYVDAHFGPSAAEVRAAASTARGWPCGLVGALASAPGPRGGAAWVHETAPEYVAVPPAAASIPAPAGVARLQRAVAAAISIAARGRHARAARLLRRSAAALAARGAIDAAAAAWCALGDLSLDRGETKGAATAFEQARRGSPAAALTARALAGTGRVLAEEGRLLEAEGAFRTATLAGDPDARRGLATVLLLRGRVDAAEDALAAEAPALASEILRLKGDLAAAAQAADRAVRETPERDPAARCEAHLAAAHVHAALGQGEMVRHHATAATAAARRSRAPARRLRAEAEALACLAQTGRPARASVIRRLLSAARRLPPLAADLLGALDACGVVIRSSRLGKPAATAGRGWPGEESLTQAVLDGACGVFRDGLTPEAAEPVRAAGCVLGSIAVRWVPGARPGIARARDLLRLSAAAAAPMLKGLTAAPAEDAAQAHLYPDDLLGRGGAADRVRDAIRRAALAPYPVLIEGESGSGKELVARAIHLRGPRRARKFCAVNCAALTDDLLEAELFGHAKGAFTGALGERPGLFEEADQGTLFLDEAGELTARAQAKLLRALQEGEVRRIGENMPRKVDVRVVAATNRSLEDDVRAGRFRADLRYRLDVIRIQIPPLRDRADDVPGLAEPIWREAAARVGTRATLGDQVIALLARYDWPGNVRELQIVVASLADHAPRRGRVPASLLPARIAGALHSSIGFDEARLDFEQRFVRAALARAGGHKGTAAAQLRVSRQGLTKILKRLGIES